MTGNKSKQNPFLLNNPTDNSSGFSNRMNAVFGNLSSLEDNHQEWQRQNRSENMRYVKLDPIIEDKVKISRAVQQETFKRPSNVLKRAYPKNCKDKFHRDPSKWKKYTLADVSDQDMSEKSNTGAAMSFLAERKRQKIDHTLNSDAEHQDKLVFTKPQKPVDGNIEKSNAVGPAGCLVMPEYVVGQKKARCASRNIRNEKPDKTKNTISLAHLEDDEQEMETDAISEPH